MSFIFQSKSYTYSNPSDIAQNNNSKLSMS